MDNHDSEGPSILFSELNRYNRTLKIDWNWKALSWRHDSQFPVSNSNASNVQYCSIHVHEKLSKLPKCRKKKYKNRTFLMGNSCQDRSWKLFPKAQLLQREYFERALHVYQNVTSIIRKTIRGPKWITYTPLMWGCNHSAPYVVL